MATSKKPSATTVKAKSTAVRRAKPTTAKAAARSKATRSSSTTSREQFLTLRVTKETIYWLIFGIVIILLAIWVWTLAMRVQNLYDQIEINSANSTPIHTVHKK